MPVCAKIICYQVRKVQITAKTHMALGTFQSTVLSIAFVAGVSLVSFLQTSDWTRVSTLDRHYFPTHFNADWHQDSAQCDVPGLVSS